jgi:hypothetical protein
LGELQNLIGRQRYYFRYLEQLSRLSKGVKFFYSEELEDFHADFIFLWKHWDIASSFCVVVTLSNGAKLIELCKTTAQSNRGIHSHAR